MFISSIIDYCIYAYLYSCVFVLCTIFFLLKYTDRHHMRERGKQYGEMVVYKINYKDWDTYVVPYCIDYILITLEICVGFCEGLSNHTPIAPIPIILNNMTQTDNINEEKISDENTNKMNEENKINDTNTKNTSEENKINNKLIKIRDIDDFIQLNEIDTHSDIESENESDGVTDNITSYGIKPERTNKLEMTKQMNGKIIIKKKIKN
jgi:hypothetical protein